MNEPQIMTAVHGEKIIDINGKPFIIPEGQITDKSKLVKCEFYMLSDDLEFLIQNFEDDALDWATNLKKILENHEDANKHPLHLFNEIDCQDMMELFRRLYHYLKPFTKQEED